jgi:hypothetical protein
MTDKDDRPKYRPLEWDKQTAEYWSSSAGFIKMEENKTWTAHLHRNTRTGKGWTESRKGFATADKARRWIEMEAED